MAIALHSPAVHRATNIKTGGTSIAITPGTALSAGDVVVMAVGCDYAATLNITATALTNMTWYKAGQTDNTGGSSTAMFLGEVTGSGITAGTNIGGTFSLSVTGRVINYIVVTGADTTNWTTVSKGSGTGSSVSPAGSVVCGTTTSWAFGAMAVEGPIGEYVAPPVSGTESSSTGTTGGGAAANQSQVLVYTGPVGGGYTASHEIEWSSARDWAYSGVELTEASTGGVTANVNTVDVNVAVNAVTATGDANVTLATQDINLAINAVTVQIITPLASSAAGVATVTGTLTASQALTGSAAGVATVTGAMEASQALTGSAAGLSTPTAVLNATLALASSAAGVATVTGVMTASQALSGTSDGLSTAAASGLSVVKDLSGTAGGIATVTGVMEAAQAISGTSGGLSTATSTLNATIIHHGSSTGVATVTGVMEASQALTGSAAGAATATGVLSTAGQVYFNGTSAGVATVTGVMEAAQALTGSSAGLSTPTGTLTASVALTSSTAGASTATGLLTTGPIEGVDVFLNSEDFQGGHSTATAMLGRIRQLDGNNENSPQGYSAVTGSLTVTSWSLVSLGTTIGGTATASGVLSRNYLVLPLSSSSGLATAIANRLNVNHGLVGTSDGVALGITSGITIQIGVTGTSGGLSTPVGDLTVTPPPTAYGSSAGSSTATATMIASRSLAGASTGRGRTYAGLPRLLVNAVRIDVEGNVTVEYLGGYIKNG